MTPRHSLINRAGQGLNGLIQGECASPASGYAGPMFPGWLARWAGRRSGPKSTSGTPPLPGWTVCSMILRRGCWRPSPASAVPPRSDEGGARDSGLLREYRPLRDGRLVTVERHPQAVCQSADLFGQPLDGAVQPAGLAAGDEQWGEQRVPGPEVPDLALPHSTRR
jgi:hypothetical protein